MKWFTNRLGYTRIRVESTWLFSLKDYPGRREATGELTRESPAASSIWHGIVPTALFSWVSQTPASDPRKVPGPQIKKGENNSAQGGAGDTREGQRWLNCSLGGMTTVTVGS